MATVTAYISDYYNQTFTRTMDFDTLNECRSYLVRRNKQEPTVATIADFSDNTYVMEQQFDRGFWTPKTYLPKY